MEAGKVILANHDLGCSLRMDAKYRNDEIRISGEAKLATATNPEQEEQDQAGPHPSCWKLLYRIMGRGSKTGNPPIWAYDWKIGIAIDCSFAHVRLLLSRLATIYSMGGESKMI